jgi:hypothetical protein
MQDTYSMLDQAQRHYLEAIESERENGEALSEATRQYRMAIEAKTLELRMDKGYPVTLIPDLVRGSAEVAPLGYERDRIRANYDADRSLVEFWKQRVYILQREIELEAKGL